MSHDRELVDTIKIAFARKSAAQLQEIVQARDQNRWSAEAITAASEVLEERRAGLAEEPEVAEEERPAPAHYDPNLVALGVLGSLVGGVLTGHLLVPRFRVSTEENPDLPVPFGPKVAWLALDTTDTEAVANALGLQGVRAATWAEGIEAAYQASVFVTPPLADWTLAVGTTLFPPDRVDTFVKPLLERLSRAFGDAQYFCTHRDVELHVWARARQGRLVRGYGWLGQKGLTLWDEGRPTTEERDLGFRFPDGRSAVVESIRLPEERITVSTKSDSGARKDAGLPDEESLMLLASLWSIDPTTLNDHFKEPVTGLLGDVPRADDRIRR